ncbi:hypothetical protein Tco_0616754, partial [Tanacetum coccineum]
MVSDTCLQEHLWDKHGEPALPTPPLQATPTPPPLMSDMTALNICRSKLRCSELSGSTLATMVESRN